MPLVRQEYLVPKFASEIGGKNKHLLSKRASLGQALLGGYIDDADVYPDNCSGNQQ